MMVKFIPGIKVVSSVKIGSKLKSRVRPVVNFINILRATFATKFQSQTVIRGKLQKELSNKKVAHKMFVKLTPVEDLALLLSVVRTEAIFLDSNVSVNFDSNFAADLVL
jgi:hypothetical protein